MQHICQWAEGKSPEYINYHNNEWGKPVHNDQKLFEMLILEGAQAGLSWETVLKKRENYRKAFFQFDIPTCAGLTDKYLQKCLQNPAIIRNRLKIFSVRQNARVFMEIQSAFGSFDAYIWSWTDGKVLNNSIKTFGDTPSKTELSDKISQDLKKRGMNFVGSTIIYAYLQAIGIVNDHENSCFCKIIVKHENYNKIKKDLQK